MMTIIRYEILKVLRNRRFVFFTLVMPLVFFLVLNAFVKPDKGQGEFITYLAVFCTLFGTAGSGLNTLSTRVAKEKSYIGSIYTVTPYSPGKFIFVTALVQLLLNVVIAAVIITFGAAVFQLKMDGMLLKMELLALYSSLYYIFLGLILGFLLDIVSLQSISFPLYLGFMSMNITKDLGFSVPGFMTHIQRFFPGYYLNQAVKTLYTGGDALQSILMMTLNIGLLLIVTLVVYRYKKNAIVA
ncbi:ABC transporter permease [Paenibacillus sp. HN-1]|uniref:ABC transporter permease n=1 Tax=Paenibacillus TaxID=44249 RepID=UPI001CA7DFAC|nr:MULTISPECIES: ABC transporter permease [Paenibacillus]MBY9077971.1 ABC transporter permease [Paenibacillus sp. CGMCC 1.18879]MBY9083925.1 ABC transporter permease [Paenibacillus sinensis]